MKICATRQIQNAVARWAEQHGYYGKIYVTERSQRMLLSPRKLTRQVGDQHD